MRIVWMSVLLPSTSLAGVIAGGFMTAVLGIGIWFVVLGEDDVWLK